MTQAAEIAELLQIIQTQERHIDELRQQLAEHVATIDRQRLELMASSAQSQTATQFDDAWMRQNARFSCEFGCDFTYAVDDVRIFNDELICDNCYDATSWPDEPKTGWWDLPELTWQSPSQEAIP